MAMPTGTTRSHANQTVDLIYFSKNPAAAPERNAGIATAATYGFPCAPQRVNTQYGTHPITLLSGGARHASIGIGHHQGRLSVPVEFEAV